MKEFIKSIKENPLEFLGNVVFVGMISLLFYVSMWVFY
jgi:hypothetical protein|tara:strand:- start:1144 stop:1257 length:114 start_codon:yes stop_codon:yes gene_type:complete